jgi:hypothetical protein
MFLWDAAWGFRKQRAPLAIFEKPVSFKPFMLLRKSAGGNRES